MTYTDEFKLLKEYVDNRTLILKQFGNSTESSKCQEGLKLLEEEYAKLLKKQRDLITKEPGKKLKVLQKRLEDMF